jgi:hypothetical protein
MNDVMNQDTSGRTKKKKPRLSGFLFVCRDVVGLKPWGSMGPDARQSKVLLVAVGTLRVLGPTGQRLLSRYHQCFQYLQPWLLQQSQTS